LALFVFLSGLSDGFSVALAMLGFVLAVFVCIFLHELGHALCAKRFGLNTRDITLLPIGGIARIEGLGGGSVSPIAEGWIAAAGPATNLLIAAGIMTAISLSSLIENATPTGVLQMSPLGQLAFANVFLAVSNLLPAFPLDGGRILRSVLCYWLPTAIATRWASRVGMWIACIIILASIYYWNLLSILLGVVLYLFNYGQWIQGQFLSMSDDLREKFRQAQTQYDQADSDVPDRGNTIDAIEVRQVGPR
jgi:Zn-dependent protease